MSVCVLYCYQSCYESRSLSISSSWLRRNIPTGRVYAVRGNHEDNVINNPDKYAWTKEATAEDLALLTTFPYTISIPLYDAIVVHAGLIPDRYSNICINIYK